MGNTKYATVNAINKLLDDGLLNSVMYGSSSKLQLNAASSSLGLCNWFIKNKLMTEAISTPAKYINPLMF